jgi:putative NADH-flavin reductase
MKLVILGANGKTGKELVNLAIERGHVVTAVTRNPEAFASVTTVKAIKADVTNSEELAKVFKGQDAVLSTLGNNNAKLRLIERSSAAIIAAMQATGVKRLVVELAFGGAEAATLSKAARTFNNLVLGKMLADQKKGVDLITKSNLDWTVLYATQLTNGALTKRIKVVSANEKIGMKHRISRADVSYAMLASATNDAHMKKLPVISGAASL